MDGEREKFMPLFRYAKHWRSLILGWLVVPSSVHCETNTGCKTANSCRRRPNQVAEASPGANHNPVGASIQQQPLQQQLSVKGVGK